MARTARSPAGAPLDPLEAGVAAHAAVRHDPSVSSDGLADR
ncbi:hypothetical protein [Halobiforma nitratireducens]|nr:hypothetical protein [Halobiforma nitratireducens]